jgi:hypothetical protein
MKTRSVTTGVSALGVVLMLAGAFGLMPRNYALFLGVVCFALVGLLPLLQRDSKPEARAEAR